MRWPRVATSPRRLVTALLVVLVLWNAAMVVTPLALPAGSVTELDGTENRMDHWPAWTDLPLPAGIVYAIGDVLCHQKHWRTVHVNGNQMPVDERMTAIFFAAVPGLALGLRARSSVYVTDALRSAIPRRLATWLPADRRRAARALVAVIALALLPAAVDVLWENLLGRESTRALRFVTGSVAGVAGGVVLAAFVVAVDAFARLAWGRFVAPRFPRLHRLVGGLVTGDAARAGRAQAPPAPGARAPR